MSENKDFPDGVRLLRKVTLDADNVRSMCWDEKSRFDLVQPDVTKMAQAANRLRDEATAVSVVEGKRYTNDYDVFFSYHHGDQPAVKQVEEALLKKGLLVWMDESSLVGGDGWLQELSKALGMVRSAVVFLGPRGIAGFQKQEVNRLIAMYAESKRPRIVPVMLPGASNLLKESLLRNFQIIDFRDKSEIEKKHALNRLAVSLEQS